MVSTESQWSYALRQGGCYQDDTILSCTSRVEMSGSRRLSPKRSPLRRWILVLVLAMPSVIGMITTWVLKNKTYATNISLTLAVSRFAFELEKAPLGDEFIRSANALSLAVTNVDRVEFRANQVFLADQKQYDVRTNSYPTEAWKKVALTESRLVFEGRSAPDLPFVRIGPKNPGGR